MTITRRGFLGLAGVASFAAGASIAGCAPAAKEGNAPMASTGEGDSAEKKAAS